MSSTRWNRFWMIPLMGALMGSMVGCSEEDAAFQAAQEQDSIQAYEDFLTKFPENNVSETVKQRLDELYYNKAMSDKTEEAYKAYLDKFGKDGKHSPEIKGSMEKIAYDKVWKDGGKAGLQEFVAQFPNGNYTAKVQGRLDALAYAEANVSVEVGKITSIDIPGADGAVKKAWELSVKFTNKGDKVLEAVGLAVDFQADGKSLATATAAAVDSTTPMAAGETRDMKVASTDIADGATPTSATVTVRDAKLAK